MPPSFQSPERPRFSGRVAIFLANLGGGGAERVFAHLIHELTSRGMAIDVVLASAEGSNLQAVQAVANIVDLRAGSAMRALWPLSRWLRQHRPDVLLTALDHVNVVAVWARKLARVPTRVVVTHHCALAALNLDDLSNKDKVLRLLVQRMYPLADAVVTVSRDSADELAPFLGLPRDRVDVIYNPVIGKDLPALAAAPLDHPWGAPDQPPLLLGIGRLTRQKDFTNLIEAFALLRQQRSARLVILGEGPDRAQLQALVAQLGLQDDVQLPGFAANPYAWLAHAQVFVLSSIFEGLPTVLIEALAAGTRVVATDCPTGPREILHGGALGRLVPMRDPQALADAIAATLDEPKKPIDPEVLRPYLHAEAADNYLRLFQRVTAASQ